MNHLFELKKYKDIRKETLNDTFVSGNNNQDGQIE